MSIASLLPIGAHVVNTTFNEFATFVLQGTLTTPTTTHLSKIEGLSFGRVLLATARIYVEAPNGSRVLARALIAQCSQVSIIYKSLCQRLRLKYRPIHAPITGVGSNNAAISNEIALFTIRPRFHSNFSCEVQALVLPRISSYNPLPFERPLQLKHLQGLELADPNYLDKGHIDVLLGASVHA